MTVYAVLWRKEGLVKTDGKDVLGVIALCGLAVAALSCATFAQQPTTPEDKMVVKIGAAVSGQAALPDVSERERLLLERIEQLERRLNELESRLNVAPPPGLANASASNVAARQPNAGCPTDSAASQQQSTQTSPPPAPPPYAAWDKDGVKIIPYGTLLANVNYNSSALVPGNLGFFRPQVRLETYRPLGDNYTFIFQGAITQAIHTLDVGAEDFGRQTSLPDGQARVALGRGNPALNEPAHKRPFELGVSGHIGERRGNLPTIPIIERDFISWSGNVDLSFKIGDKLRFEAEYFRGSILGSYSGGIFQTFNPVRKLGIRGAGAWAQLIYNVNDKWQVTGGYGRDDPYNRDLAIGQRSLNEMGFGNFFHKITPRLWFGLEFSGWKTTWVDLPTGRAFRIEPAVLFFF